MLNHDFSCFQGKTGGTKERSPVIFPHEAHMDVLECLDCHHLYENGENVLDESDLEEGDPNTNCCSCHNSTTKINLEDAFHNSCIPCHNENSKKFWIPRKGIQWKAFLTPSDQLLPTLCGECHILPKSTSPE
ncbi:cytochrome c3 family protein [Desulfocicer vacuolatum]|uniref:cytochrome c3 family protein n=1 Tax=Desulfocicer vacuolatum TaxID=2298 RepID=UPI001E508748|nr:cytochrome c3 family protein [Desulfocicer vacuolatum]